jgi:hypothetical protein
MLGKASWTVGQRLTLVGLYASYVANILCSSGKLAHTRRLGMAWEAL